MPCLLCFTLINGVHTYLQFFFFHNALCSLATWVVDLIWVAYIHWSVMLHSAMLYWIPNNGWLDCFRQAMLTGYTYIEIIIDRDLPIWSISPLSSFVYSLLSCFVIDKFRTLQASIGGVPSEVLSTVTSVVTSHLVKHYVKVFWCIYLDRSFGNSRE